MSAVLSLVIAAALAAGGPLTLNEAVQAAITADPRLRQAELDLERAGVTESGARSEQFQYTGDLSAGNWTGASGLFSGSPVTPMSVPTGNAEVAARYPVFTGWKIANQIEAAEAGVTSARARLDQTRQDVIYGVTEAYWLARRGELRAAIQAEAVEKARQARALVGTNVTIGKSSTAELDRAEVALLNEESEQLRLTSDAERARDQLGSLLQRDLSGVALTDPEGGAVQEDLPSEARLREALDARPDLRRALADVAAQRATVGVASADRWPQFEVLTSYQHGNNPFFATSQNRSVLAGFVGTWNAQVNLRYHLFDHGVIARNVAARSLELAAAEQALEATRRTAELEARQAQRRLELAGRRVAIGARAETLAAKNLTWVEGRFKFGYALLTELNEARGNLVSARNQRLDSEIDYRLALAALRKSLGRLAAPRTRGVTS